ncbi:lysophospholipid acyltransferase family protein [Ammonicoccus fulvus]|uniref:Lysophospholipid acyltransferase family protein n=1 Tax=Ammonicoccus fulvus TaxID=3138240 RepID=A0ABZ3FN38_9ACTN
MSTPESEETRALAAWANGGGKRRACPLAGLIADVRRLLSGARWEGPGDALPATVPAPAAGRRGSVRGRLALVPPGVTVDGPDPAALPAGPVILVANHPTPAAAGLVLSRLAPQRRRRTITIAGPHEELDARTRLTRPVLRLDQTNPGAALSRLQELLGRGWSVLIFPEGGPAAGATRPAYHPFAALLAEGTGLPVVPVGIRGARAVGAQPGHSRVSVRFGDPLHAGADARDQEAAIESLIAEDGATWWQVQRAEPGHLPGTKPPESAHSWRHVWAQTARPKKGGVAENPRIWR